ncbi:MAG: hypothetical protein OXG81_12455 [Acidobacteria bacterium]|nr:hypothetical protein [Acidobacteriota bacterium]MCY3963622.1 hypothetical protein [Acidobacteriota bacterium]MCY3968803.1 hypothetical protein [Acidobacteriota bacterium]
MKWLLVGFLAAFGGGLLAQRIAESRDHPVWRPRTELAVAWVYCLLALASVAWFWSRGLELIGTGTSVARWAIAASVLVAAAVALRLAELSTSKHSSKGATAGPFWERRPVREMVFCTDLAGMLCALLALLLSTRPEEPTTFPLPLLVLVLSSTILRQNEK